jgi:hypothetical protein
MSDKFTFSPEQHSAEFSRSIVERDHVVNSCAYKSVQAIMSQWPELFTPPIEPSVEVQAEQVIREVEQIVRDAAPTGNQALMDAAYEAINNARQVNQ